MTTCAAPAQQPVPHKDYSDLYEKMSGKGESAGEAHLGIATLASFALQPLQKHRTLALPTELLYHTVRSQKLLQRPPHCRAIRWSFGDIIVPLEA
jgi:hypothetical protein